jgi:ribosome-binding protein aMBF1 (putative translation factor)
MNKRLKAKIYEVFGTQADFAQAMKEDESIVSRIVRGRRRPDDEQRKKWAAALDCKPEQLFSE